MEEKKSKILKGQFAVSVIYILFGVCLALMPVETVNVLCKVVFGLVLIGAGLYHIVLFVLEKENATVLDLFSGVIVFVIGVFLFMNPQVVIKLLTLMLGAFILVDSIWMLRGSLKLKKRELGVWKAFLLAGLIFVGLGIMLLLNPFSELKMTMQVAGWIFVANGVVDVIFYFLYRHGMKKEVPVKGENKKAELRQEEKQEPEERPDSEAEPEPQEEKNGEADLESVEGETKSFGQKLNLKKRMGRKEQQASEESQTGNQNLKETKETIEEKSGEKIPEAGENKGNIEEGTTEAKDSEEGNIKDDKIEVDESEEEVLEEWKD